MKCENCDIEYRSKSFSTTTVLYCEKCGNYKVVREPECEHEYILILFKLANGTRQLREYCPKCHTRTKNILPQKNRDLSGVKQGDEERYHEFISKIHQPTIEEEREFISRLQDLQRKFYYSEYDQHINSDVWKAMSRRIQERDNYRCRICGEPSSDTHHLNYAHFGSEYEFELVSLCRKCHMDEYHSPRSKQKTDSLRIPKEH
jgi:hypothetical protein